MTFCDAYATVGSQYDIQTLPKGHFLSDEGSSGAKSPRCSGTPRSTIVEGCQMQIEILKTLLKHHRVIPDGRERERKRDRKTLCTFENRV